jgi:MOSC domain-containing protein YiiM
MTVVGIYVQPEATKPMEWRDAVIAIVGVGLDGDRYALGTGTYSGNPGSGRHVTLIEEEAILAVTAEGGIALEPSETRRNVVTRGVALNHLVGRRFSVGGAVLQGMRLCEPCAHLDRLTRAGVREGLVHRGGLRAEVVAGGSIRVGDPLAVSL